MAYIDLGQKETVLGVTSPRESDVYYPTIYIEGKDLPFDKDDVGEITKADVVVKLTSLTTRNEGGGDKITYTFEVRKIDFLKNKEREDYTRGRVETKKKAGG